MNGTRWPKSVPPLTADQQRISDDFMRHWHEVLPKKFGLVERFNHRYAIENAPSTFERTIEIGAGIGGHLPYERLTPAQENAYVALELRESMAAKIRARFPRVQACVGDCQQRLVFPDGHFDRILAIHVLEHLPNLPAAIREMRRLCDPTRGILSVVIPCEGGWAYSVARKISAQRIFERRYHQSYRWFIEREHINRPHEIIAELEQCFEITHRRFFPLGVPVVDLNLCIGLTLKPRKPLTSSPGGTQTSA